MVTNEREPFMNIKHLFEVTQVCSMPHICTSSYIRVVSVLSSDRTGSLGLMKRKWNLELGSPGFQVLVPTM